MVMLVAVIWLGVVGGGDVQWAALVAIVDYRHMDGDRLCILLLSTQKANPQESFHSQVKKCQTKKNIASTRSKISLSLTGSSSFFKILNWQSFNYFLEKYLQYQTIIGIIFTNSADNQNVVWVILKL